MLECGQGKIRILLRLAVLMMKGHSETKGAQPLPDINEESANSGEEREAPESSSQGDWYDLQLISMWSGKEIPIPIALRTGNGLFLCARRLCSRRRRSA